MSLNELRETLLARILLTEEMFLKRTYLHVVNWNIQASTLTFPYSPPLPMSTPISLQSSQIGTNFSGGNGVFDSYSNKTRLRFRIINWAGLCTAFLVESRQILTCSVNSEPTSSEPTNSELRTPNQPYGRLYQTPFSRKRPRHFKINRRSIFRAKLSVASSRAVTVKKT